jgi:predicted ATPase
MELDFGSIRFCGRYKEVQQLNVVLDQVRGECLPGTPRTNHNNRNSSGSIIKPCHKMVAIEGPGGTGKSMLVEHFLESIAQKQRLSRPFASSAMDHPHHDAIALSTGGGSLGSGGPLILVGRGKFEESSTMPFASFAECIGSLLDELMSIDPEWSDTLTADTRRELRCLSSIVPNLKAILSANNRDEAASTVGSGGSDTSSGSQSGRQWVRFC